jgi:hypothetical protein
VSPYHLSKSSGYRFKVINIEDAGFPLFLENSLYSHANLYFVQVNLAQKVDESGICTIQLDDSVCYRKVSFQQLLLGPPRRSQHGVGKKFAFGAYLHPLIERGETFLAGGARGNIDLIAFCALESHYALFVSKLFKESRLGPASFESIRYEQLSGIDYVLGCLLSHLSSPR